MQDSEVMVHTLTLKVGNNSPNPPNTAKRLSLHIVLGSGKPIVYSFGVQVDPLYIVLGFR